MCEIQGFPLEARKYEKYLYAHINLLQGAALQSPLTSSTYCWHCRVSHLHLEFLNMDRRYKIRRRV